MTPTVGRIVHYWESPDATPEAAIVTAVGSVTVILTVFHTHRLPTIERAVPFTEGSTDGERAWWPAREDDA